jgi:hypothetical protein
MDRQLTTQDKSEAWRGDFLFAAIMLVICCVFTTGLISIPLWLSKQNQKIISANATSTAFAVATQQINATATAMARFKEQNQYEYIERFDQPSGYWFVGLYEKQYADARISIKDGVYIWDVANSKDSTQSTDFSKKDKIKDFDVFMDTKFVENSAIDPVCSGFFFRRQPTWDDGAYIFTICNDSHFEVHYHHKNKWQPINLSDHEGVILPFDWNRIEISARGDHFIFTVNNTEVFEMNDDRLNEGNLGIFVDIGPGGSAVIWFDNFGFQSR